MSHVDSAKADAYHEAGHAVAAVVLGTGLVDVDIRSQRVNAALNLPLISPHQCTLA
jgi:hypothetical protein